MTADVSVNLAVDARRSVCTAGFLKRLNMSLLLLEALAALLIFVLIVWWTMFSGRKPEESAEVDTDAVIKRDHE